MENFAALCLLFALFILFACAEEENILNLNAEPSLVNGLSCSFCKTTCPKLESTIEKRIDSYLKKDIVQAAGLLCPHFHDCFVQGCDASVLLDGSASGPSEQEAPPNLTRRAKAFEIINDIKERVDKGCVVIVSCSDITDLTASDSVSERSVGTMERVIKGRRLLQSYKPKSDPNKLKLHPGHGPGHN